MRPDGQEGCAMTNEEIARRLRKRASIRARGGENLYRIRAFRQAAMAVLGLPVEVSTVVAGGGVNALERVSGIAKRLADTIARLAEGSGEDPLPSRTTSVTLRSRKSGILSQSPAV